MMAKMNFIFRIVIEKNYSNKNEIKRFIHFFWILKFEYQKNKFCGIVLYLSVILNFLMHIFLIDINDFLLNFFPNLISHFLYN